MSHRAVAGGQVGDASAVHRSVVGLAVEVVVGDRDAVGARRQVEVDDAVEATRPQQRRIEVGGAVGGRDEQDVGAWRLRARAARDAPAARG